MPIVKQLVAGHVCDPEKGQVQIRCLKLC